MQVSRPVGPGIIEGVDRTSSPHERAHLARKHAARARDRAQAGRLAAERAQRAARAALEAALEARNRVLQRSVH
ncbi:hypothetical protein GCM10020218_042860 [Dactylosporangium vinaceum]